MTAGERITLTFKNGQAICGEHVLVAFVTEPDGRTQIVLNGGFDWEVSDELEGSGNRELICRVRS